MSLYRNPIPPLPRRLQALDQVYDLMDDLVRGTPLACKKGCAYCCTGNVTMTTLEGYRMTAALYASGREGLLLRMTAVCGKDCFQPALTINQIAEWCAAGRELPDEAVPANPPPCPWLTENVCPVYEARPFGCRAMVSVVDCSQTGCAETDPFVLSAVNVLQQFIEALDVSGGFGNFTRVLQWMADPHNREGYARGAPLISGLGLVPNRPLKVLMVPPEHRSPMDPLLQRLEYIRRELYQPVPKED